MEEKKSFKDFICSPLGKGAMIAVLYVVILGVFVLLLTSTYESSSGIPAVIMALCFGFFGWKSLNKIRPSLFLIMPVVGWLFYFAIKGLISVIIGMFIAPFVISRKVTETIQRNV
ncbi:MAG: hypothetical protein IK955_04060 [Clostridia bacterium]|nr:hypothetical protein [Clostridia bacterium]